MDAQIGRDDKVNSESFRIDDADDLMTTSNLKKQCLEQLSSLLHVPDMDLLSAIGHKAVQIGVPKHILNAELVLIILLGNLKLKIDSLGQSLLLVLILRHHLSFKTLDFYFHVSELVEIFL